MNIAIISSCSLPIPAVKGGAVESLIHTIIEQNEKTENRITVFGLYDEKASQLAKTYNKTHFEYFKKESIIEYGDTLVTSVLRRIKNDKTIASKNYIWKICLLKKLKDALRKRDFDKVILENTIFLFDIFSEKDLYTKYVNKVYFHVHNNLIKSTKVDISNLLNGVISISDYLHENIRHYMGDGFAIKTVHNGISCEMFSKELASLEKTKLKMEIGIPKENEVVLFAGRITPEKGIIEAIRGFQLLKRSNVSFLIVGACYFGSGAISEFENELRRLIDHNSSVYTTGFVAYDQIWKYYAIADVAVLPSMWEEPLGLTMIEAQAAGVPLITTNSGGIPETVSRDTSIIIEKDSNVAVSIANAIEMILGDKESWAFKANKAQQRVQTEFNSETFYKNFIDALA